MGGYWLVRGTVKESDAYAEYAQRWAPIGARFNAQFLARSGAHETREGADFPRVAIIAFPSYEQALACYDDSDYQALLPLVERAYENREIVIVEGGTA